MINLQTPLTKDIVKTLKAGDMVKITGVIYTARDAAHKRLIELIEHNEPLPFDLKDNIIYYVGPTPENLEPLLVLQVQQPVIEWMPTLQLY